MATVYPNGLGRGRPKGLPKTGGRPPGRVNKITQEVQAIARGLVEDPIYMANLTSRLQSGDLAPQVECTLWHYAYGKPKEIHEVTGAGGAPLFDLRQLNDAQLSELDATLTRLFTPVTEPVT